MMLHTSKIQWHAAGFAYGRQEGLEVQVGEIPGRGKFHSPMSTFLAFQATKFLLSTRNRTQTTAQL